MPSALAVLATSLEARASDGADQSRAAAVLVLLTVEAGRAEVLLIRRPEHLRHHADQMACPGGAREPQDRTLWDTALRETREEVGIRREQVARVGLLPRIHIAVSGFTVSPWVGWTPARPLLRPAAGEVAGVLWVPLGDLRRVYRRAWRGQGPTRFLSPEFPVAGVVVWGATGRMLEALLERLSPAAQDRLEQEAASWS